MTACTGSPPQVRGKPASAIAVIICVRITPAGAGKTSLIKSPCKSGWDHPRRCGENFLLEPFRRINLGSPPQVRGKPKASGIFVHNHRITPAGAGKTQRGHFFQRSFQDHPRRCGENAQTLIEYMGSDGSPPQVRGKPALRRDIGCGKGITPAGAGKTAVIIYADIA